jgi:hypothetical protein
MDRRAAKQRRTYDLDEMIEHIKKLLKREQAKGAGDRTLAYSIDGEMRFTRCDHTPASERVF